MIIQGRPYISAQEVLAAYRENMADCAPAPVHMPVKSSEILEGEILPPERAVLEKQLLDIIERRSDRRAPYKPFNP